MLQIKYNTFDRLFSHTVRTENNLVIGARISSVSFHTLYLSTSSLDPKKERSCQIPCKDRGEDKPLTMLMGIAIWSCSINTNGITRSFPCSFIELFRNTRRSYTHDHVTFKKWLISSIFDKLFLEKKRVIIVLKDGIGQDLICFGLEIWKKLLWMTDSAFDEGAHNMLDKMNNFKE